MRHAAERKASIDPVSEIGTVQGPLMERRHELNGRHRLLIRGAAPVCNLVPGLSKVVGLADIPRPEFTPLSGESQFGLQRKLADDFRAVFEKRDRKDGVEGKSGTV